MDHSILEDLEVDSEVDYILVHHAVQVAVVFDLDLADSYNQDVVGVEVAMHNRSVSVPELLDLAHTSWARTVPAPRMGYVGPVQLEVLLLKDASLALESCLCFVPAVGSSVEDV